MLHSPLVVGFAVSSGTDQGGTLVHCSQLNPSGADCISPTSSLAPCCELQKIAVAGQPPTNNPHAYFVGGGSMFLILSLYLQQGLAKDTLSAALCFTAFAIAVLASSIFASRRITARATWSRSGPTCSTCGPSSAP